MQRSTQMHYGVHRESYSHADWCDITDWLLERAGGYKSLDRLMPDVGGVRQKDEPTMLPSA